MSFASLLDSAATHERAMPDVDAAVLRNFHRLRAALPGHVRIAVVAKGFNDIVPRISALAKALTKGDIELVAVSTPNASLQLRASGYRGRIMLLYATSMAIAPELVAAGVELVVPGLWWLQGYAALRTTQELLPSRVHQHEHTSASPMKASPASASSAPLAPVPPARLHVMVDTGMGREGVMPEDVELILEWSMAHKDLVEVIGLGTHLCCEAYLAGHPLAPHHHQLPHAGNTSAMDGMAHAAHSDRSALPDVAGSSAGMLPLLATGKGDWRPVDSPRDAPYRTQRDLTRHATVPQLARFDEMLSRLRTRSLLRNVQVRRSRCIDLPGLTSRDIVRPRPTAPERSLSRLASPRLAALRATCRFTPPAQAQCKTASAALTTTWCGSAQLCLRWAESSTPAHGMYTSTAFALILQSGPSTVTGERHSRRARQVPAEASDTIHRVRGERAHRETPPRQVRHQFRHPPTCTMPPDRARPSRIPKAVHLISLALTRQSQLVTRSPTLSWTFPGLGPANTSSFHHHVHPLPRFALLRSQLLHRLLLPGDPCLPNKRCHTACAQARRC